VKQVAWNTPALDDLAKLDRNLAHRIKQAIERLVESNVGDVKKLVDVDPPAFRLRVGDYRVRFRLDGETIRIVRILNRKDAYR
jgi:mRNA interferase RelE/StbE